MCYNTSILNYIFRFLISFGKSCYYRIDMFSSRTLFTKHLLPVSLRSSSIQIICTTWHTVSLQKYLRLEKFHSDLADLQRAKECLFSLSLKLGWQYIIITEGLGCAIINCSYCMETPASCSDTCSEKWKGEERQFPFQLRLLNCQRLLKKIRPSNKYRQVLSVYGIDVSKMQSCIFLLTYLFKSFNCHSGDRRRYKNCDGKERCFLWGLRNSVCLVYHEERWEITLVLPVLSLGNNVQC